MIHQRIGIHLDALMDTLTYQFPTPRPTVEATPLPSAISTYSLRNEHTAQSKCNVVISKYASVSVATHLSIQPDCFHSRAWVIIENTVPIQETASRISPFLTYQCAQISHHQPCCVFPPSWQLPAPAAPSWPNGLLPLQKPLASLCRSFSARRFVSSRDLALSISTPPKCVGP